MELPIDLIAPNPYQPRTTFDEAELVELSESIRTHGLLQPIIVRKAKDAYELVAGERRLRACRMAGLATVPAIIKELSSKDAAEITLIENLQRRDLNPIEEASGYNRLLTEFQMTQEELALIVGKGQSTVANKLRLLRLPGEVQDAISREIISERHARALLRLPDARQQLEVLKDIIERDLSVRETEELVSIRVDGKPEDKAGPSRKRHRPSGAMKDLRIFLNSIRSVVKEMRNSGVRVAVDEEERENGLEVRILIEKAR